MGSEQDQPETFDALEPSEQATLIARWTVKLAGFALLFDLLRGNGLQLRTLVGGVIGLAVAGVFYLRSHASTVDPDAYFRRTGEGLLTAPGFAAIGAAVAALWAHIPASMFLNRSNVDEVLPQDWLFVHGIFILGFAGFAWFLAGLTLLSPKTTGSSKLAAVIALAVATAPVVEWVARYQRHDAATAVSHQGSDGIVRSYKSTGGHPAAKWFGRDGQFVEVVVEPFAARPSTEACREHLSYRMKRISRRMDEAPFDVDHELPSHEWCRFSA